MDLSLEQFADILTHSPLSDILVTGYIDGGSSIHDKIKPRRAFGQFHALWDEVYLEVGDRLLRLKAADACTRLEVKQVDMIECSFDIDPDDTFGVTSVLRMLLPSGRESAQTRQIEGYVDPDQQTQGGIIVAVGLLLDQDDYLFFDPLDAINGIHVGSVQARESWLKWTQGRYPLVRV